MDDTSVQTVLGGEGDRTLQLLCSRATGRTRQAILSGQLPSGTPLREAAVAALGGSCSTLREAARTPESAGLIRYQMNRGIVVADVSGPDVARTAVELAGVDEP